MITRSHEHQVRATARYFTSFAHDYHRAFEGKGRDPLHRLINVLFRRKTFQRRLGVIRRLLEEHGLEGKRVLDLGCGSGEVALMAARMGGLVTGLDVVEAMVDQARVQAFMAGLEEATLFRLADATTAPLPESDVTLVVSVCEYYADVGEFLARACRVTRERVILVDTRGPWWRRGLRHLLARSKGFRVHYRSPEDFASLMAASGFVETARVRGHSFWALSFARAGAAPGAP